MKLIIKGARGADVKQLQKRLVTAGYDVDVDGIFGSGTEKAVRDYQGKHSLVTDGVVGIQTWNTLMGIEKPNNPKTLNQSDIQNAAVQLGVDIASVMAVTEIEARAHGFDVNGNPIILFERHHFYRQLVKRMGADEAIRLSSLYPNLCNPKPGGYLGGRSEWHRLQQAMSIDETAGLMSASFGLFQIMGFNYDICGFDTVQDFYTAMCQSEANHLQAFVSFLSNKANAGMLKALKAQNWATFAKLYNGPNYAINNYDFKLAGAYRRNGGKGKAA